ncbi:MAG: VanZ family protein [candidate division Zixibacteria bacterium]|nr:VanZ family protein [candidate division Zixibacteria bacterium]
MALIFWGSALTGGEADEAARRGSGLETPVEIQRLKDIAHLIEYGILSVLLARGFTQRTYRLSWRQVLLCIVLATAYGITDELHQLFVPNRYSGMDDVIRNTAGAIVGVAVVFAWSRLRGRETV